MKVRVIKEYINKHTQKFHAVGEVIDLTDERFAEIERAGQYVEEIRHTEHTEQDSLVSESLESGSSDKNQEQSDQTPAGDQEGYVKI